jgi:hypothetical protein
MMLPVYKIRQNSIVKIRTLAAVAVLYDSLAFRGVALASLLPSCQGPTRLFLVATIVIHNADNLSSVCIDCVVFVLLLNKSKLIQAIRCRSGYQAKCQIFERSHESWLGSRRAILNDCNTKPERLH